MQAKLPRRPLNPRLRLYLCSPQFLRLPRRAARLTLHLLPRSLRLRLRPQVSQLPRPLQSPLPLVSLCPVELRRPTPRPTSPSAARVSAPAATSLTTPMPAHSSPKPHKPRRRKHLAEATTLPAESATNKPAPIYPVLPYSVTRASSMFSDAPAVGAPSTLSKSSSSSMHEDLREFALTHLSDSSLSPRPSQIAARPTPLLPAITSRVKAVIVVNKDRPPSQPPPQQPPLPPPPPLLLPFAARQQQLLRKSAAKRKSRCNARTPTQQPIVFPAQSTQVPCPTAPLPSVGRAAPLPPSPRAALPPPASHVALPQPAPHPVLSPQAPPVAPLQPASQASPQKPVPVTPLLRARAIPDIRDPSPLLLFGSPAVLPLQTLRKSASKSKPCRDVRAQSLVLAA